ARIAVRLATCANLVEIPPFSVLAPSSDAGETAAGCCFAISEPRAADSVTASLDMVLVPPAQHVAERMIANLRAGNAHRATKQPEQCSRIAARRASGPREGLGGYSEFGRRTG